MTSVKLVKAEIERFLASNAPEVMCISGEWGVGKTYTWQTMLADAKDKNNIGLKRYSYVSLFGINSLDALKFAITENLTFLYPDSADDLEASLRKGGNLLVNVFSKVAQLGTALPMGIGELIKQAGPLYFSAVQNQIICIDDLERRGDGLSVADVLGLISFLREQRGCKIVLLLNDEKLDPQGKKEFREYLEKVVDVSLLFAPTAEECANIALTKADKINVWLRENCIALSISNIRVIAKIERFVRMLEPLVKKYDEGVLKSAAKTITLYAWAKLEPQKAPSAEYLKVNKRSEEWLVLPDNEKLTPDQKKWEAVLSQYGFGHTDDLDYALMNSIDAGYYDPEEVARLASVENERIIAAQQTDSFDAAVNLYRDSFYDNEDHVVAELCKSFKANFRIMTVQHLNFVVGLLKELGHNENASELLQYYLHNKAGDAESWDIESARFGGEISDPEIVQAFNERFALLKPKPDPVEILLRVSKSNSWGSSDTPVIAALSVDDYVKMFKSHKGTVRSRIIKTALMFEGVSGVPKNATEALKTIGRESKLNARRVRAFGIKL
jgi:hypothetical protein